MNKLILSTLLLAPSASAFFQQKPKVATPAAAASSINGWVADESQFAYGLPGSLDPVPEFDPLGFTSNMRSCVMIRLVVALGHHCILSYLSLACV